MRNHDNLPRWIPLLCVLFVCACGAEADAGQPPAADAPRQELAKTTAPAPVAETPAPTGDSGASEPAPGTVIQMPAAQTDTINIERGAILDVWLNNREGDLKILTNTRSIGSAIVTGDLFRYNQVTTDPDLREFWGKPLLLKWSGLLEITEAGTYVFVFDLSKTASGHCCSSMDVQTLISLDDQSVFNIADTEGVTRTFSHTDSRELSLAKGFHKLEVWLAVGDDGGWNLPADTDLGAFIKIRSPRSMTAEPLNASQVWHRTR